MPALRAARLSPAVGDQSPRRSNDYGDRTKGWRSARNYLAQIDHRPSRLSRYSCCQREVASSSARRSIAAYGPLGKEKDLIAPTDAAVPGAAPSRPRGTVTLLFADLVGSTELLEQLGDEEADVVRRDFFRILRSAIAAQGGREVKSLGDGLMATFESAFDAVNCAVRIQRALSDPTHHIAPRQLQVRIGVHAGEPIRDEDDYFGSTVVVARRLCETARPAQILASEVVRGLVGSRGGFHFTEASPVRLKGFSNPVAVCEIVWNASVLDLRLPQALQQADADAIAGREEDLQRLSDIWADAVQRERLRLVLLKGDPGIGKTRTAAELAHDVHRSGALVLYGRSEEGLAAPYHPFITALDGLGAAIRSESAPGSLGSAAEEVARLALEASRLPAALQLQAEEARYRLFKDVAAMLRAAAGTRPTLLVLDDLHWADRSSLLLLGFLVDELNATPLVVLGTYRDVELDLGHPLTQSSGFRHPAGERSRLRPSSAPTSTSNCWSPCPGWASRRCSQHSRKRSTPRWWRRCARVATRSRTH